MTTFALLVFLAFALGTWALARVGDVDEGDVDAEDFWNKHKQSAADVYRDYNGDER